MEINSRPVQIEGLENFSEFFFLILVVSSVARRDKSSQGAVTLLSKALHFHVSSHGLGTVTRTITHFGSELVGLRSHVSKL